MARTRGQKGYFDFSRGIITEGSKLTYEGNSLLDAMNMSFTPGKPLKKRLGQFSSPDDSVTIRNTGYYFPNIDSPGVVGKWLWKNAGGIAGNDIFVFVDGNVLVGLKGLSVVFRYDLVRFDFNDPDRIAPTNSASGISSKSYNITRARFASIQENLYIVAQYESLPSSIGTKSRTSRLFRVSFPGLSERGSFGTTDVTMVPVQYRDFGDASTIPNEVPLPVQDSTATVWTEGPYEGQLELAVYDLFNRGWTHLFNNMYQSRWPLQDSMRDIYQPA